MELAVFNKSVLCVSLEWLNCFQIMLAAEFLCSLTERNPRLLEVITLIFYLEVVKLMNATKWGIIGGTITFLLIVGGVAFFVFWKCKNKRTQSTVATHNVGYGTTGQQGPGAGNYPVQQEYPLPGPHAAYAQQQGYPRQPDYYVLQGDPPHHEGIDYYIWFIQLIFLVEKK